MGTAAIQESSGHPNAGRREEVKRHVEELVARGGLRRGAKLPSILELSRTLGVAKNTVIAALDELCSEGLLEARERAGFFVSHARRRERAHKTRLSDLEDREIDRVAHGMATTLTQTGDDLLGIGGGTSAESLLATPEWTAFLKSTPPREPHVSLRYADPLGEPALREAVVARFGSPDEPTDRVIVTHGAVDALNHVFAVAAATTGIPRIAIESPGYFMLAPMVLGLGLEPVPIPRSADALDLDRLRKEAQRGLAAVMVNPNHHNPIGATLTLSERFELARLADEKRFYIVEDDVYRGLYLDDEEPPTIRSLLPQRTVFVSSFSKTLGPGLRVGFILAPDALLEPVRRRKFLQSLSGDAYTQNMVAEFVDRRGYQRHLTEVRAELGRRARIARVQAEPFGKVGRLKGAFRGGLFWQFELAAGIDPMALYKSARERGVLLSPGWFFHSEVPVPAARVQWMRLNVSRCEGDTLSRTLKTLQSLVS
jgi:DNA-binding transcriptional MocR family regulator